MFISRDRTGQIHISPIQLCEISSGNVRCSNCFEPLAIFLGSFFDFSFFIVGGSKFGKYVVLFTLDKEISDNDDTEYNWTWKISRLMRGFGKKN